jgi:hypothetical protein
MRVLADDVICGVTALALRGDTAVPAASGAPGRRAPAGRQLAQVVARARAYNADPGRLLTIASLMVLGSGPEPDGCCWGGLELAVSAVRRECDRDAYVRKVLAYGRASGRRFGAFHELLYWPDRELRMVLKNRSPAISITDQDVSSLAGRAELVYAASEDPDAIAPGPGARGHRPLPAARLPG